MPSDPSCDGTAICRCGSRVDPRTAAVPGLLRHGDVREYLQDDLPSIGQRDGLALQRHEHVQHL
eukprot:8170269-Heterocapsa_arctica.AAC.1